MDLSEFDIDFLSQKISDNPQSPLFARLADLYLLTNQSSEALKLCEAGVQTYPTYATGFVVLGKCYRALNENSKAKLAFTQALHLSPFNQIARSQLAELLHTVDESADVGNQEAVAQPPVEEISQPAPPPAEVVTEYQIPAAGDAPEPETVVEQIPPSPLVEDQMTEIPQSEEPQISEPPPVTFEAAPEKPEVFSEPSQPEAPQPVENVPLPGLEEYIQENTANLASDNLISLDQYLASPSAPATVPEPPAPPTELDDLTSKLENAGRIVPQNVEPEASPRENIPSDSLVITPTLAEIYASQGEYGAAIQAYEILLLSKPDERGRFEKRIKELQAKLYDGA